MRMAGASAALVAALAAAVLAAALTASCRMPAGETPAGSPNARCYECHIDFRTEELTVLHEKEGITCVRCHGGSKPHMDDEVRKTPPDAIFRGPTMKVFCLTCHDPAKHGKVSAHATAEAKVREGGKGQSCTECHGEHRLVRAEPKKPGN